MNTLHCRSAHLLGSSFPVIAMNNKVRLERSEVGSVIQRELRDHPRHILDVLEQNHAVLKGYYRLMLDLLNRLVH